METTDDRRGGLLDWQWALYANGHHDRTNLALHAATVPLFWIGTLALPLAPLAWWLPLAGIAAMAGAVVAQGRGHAREATAPVPFRGPADVVVRLLAEQWITFPRFVVTGGFARAWRAAGEKRGGGHDGR
jgi:hypothetical protein